MFHCQLAVDVLMLKHHRLLLSGTGCGPGLQNRAVRSAVLDMRGSMSACVIIIGLNDTGRQSMLW
jgi:hypothetical protein